MIGLALPPPGARAFYDRQRDHGASHTNDEINLVA
jgi:hypothetical protein